MLERDVESDLVDKVRRLHGAAYKFTSPNRRNVPDRIVLQAIPPDLRPVVARYIRFVELKATGVRPSNGQLREHERLRALGFTVEVSDTPETNTDVVLAMAKGQP